MSESCHNCYFQRMVRYSVGEYAECRKYPPKYIKPVDTDREPAWEWTSIPDCKPKWCGEYQSSAERKEKRRALVSSLVETLTGLHVELSSLRAKRDDRATPLSTAASYAKSITVVLSEIEVAKLALVEGSQ